MSDNTDDRDAREVQEVESPAGEDGIELSFGAFSVLSPGVEIVLDGRPVSAPGND